MRRDGLHGIKVWLLATTYLFVLKKVHTLLITREATRHFSSTRRGYKSGHVLFGAHAVHNGVDVIGDIVPLTYAIQNHAFSDGDHVGRHLVQYADNGALIAVVRTGIVNKGE